MERREASNTCLRRSAQAESDEAREHVPSRRSQFCQPRTNGRTPRGGTRLRTAPGHPATDPARSEKIKTKILSSALCLEEREDGVEVGATP